MLFCSRTSSTNTTTMLLVATMLSLLCISSRLFDSAFFVTGFVTAPIIVPTRGGGGGGASLISPQTTTTTTAQSPTRLLELRTHVRLEAKQSKTKKKKQRRTSTTTATTTAASGASGFGKAAGKWDGCESLRTWLRENGAKVEGLNVGVVGAAAGGGPYKNNKKNKSNKEGGLRGVTAARDFKRGDVLFSVPREKCILDENKADQSPMADVIYPTGFDRNKLPPPIRVALFLLWLERGAAEQRAAWEPAIAAFPSVSDFQKGGGPMELWSDDEVAQVECGQLIAQVHSRKVELRTLYDERILPRWVAAMEGDDTTPLTGIEPPTFEELKHAVCVVTSRNFGEGATDGGSSSMLVPGIDLCNHDDPSVVNTGHSLSPEGNFVVVATKSITAGEEVLITYGPLPNHLLLAQFGFMLLDRENPLVSDTALVRIDGLFDQDGNKEKEEQGHAPTTAASESVADSLWENSPGPAMVHKLKGCNRLRTGRVSRWQTALSARVAADLVAEKTGQEGEVLYRGLLERELASYSRALREDEADLAGPVEPFSMHAFLALRFRIHSKRMLEKELEALG